MFLWDDVGETRIGVDGADPVGPDIAALLDACTVPIVVHDHARAGVLGTATLLRDGRRCMLLTAAHLFEGLASSGNWLVPERVSGQLLPLEGAQVRIVPGADIAIVHLGRVAALPRLLRDRYPIPVRHALRRWRGRAAHHCLAGYPAVWSRFERGYLAAKRLTITTSQHESKIDGVHCRYGHIAKRTDGQFVHTPALEGMSGAAIWEIDASAESWVIHLAGVQSAFVHSRYLRGEVAQLCEPLLNA